MSQEDAGDDDDDDDAKEYPAVPTENHKVMAATDLQNPSDALEILAQVADQAGENQLRHSLDLAGCDGISYDPLSTGAMTLETINHLFAKYGCCSCRVTCG